MPANSTSSSPSDAAPSPWDAFRANPTDATFRPLYEETRDRVYTICLRALRNEEDARDAFQGAYARLLALARECGGGTGAGIDSAQAARAEETVRAAGGWPGVALRMAVLEAGRLRKKRGRRQEKEIAVEELPARPDAAPRPDQAAALRETRLKLEALVATLPERYRLPVELHYFHGLSQTEIALADALPQ